jgi:hypothetical protein
MASKPTIARAVHANRGLEMAYRRAIEAMIADMHKSYLYWITAEYRKNPPRMAKVVEQAQDAWLPSLEAMGALKDLGARWANFFKGSAQSVGKKFAMRLFDTSNRAFQSSLKDAGWAVEFKMTPAMRDAMQAKIEENVGLIKSIPAKYHDQVQGIVMRNYAKGSDLQAMREELSALYPEAKNRATLISRDQSNKINAVVTQARQMELGIKEGIWVHSHGGKVPRPDHVAANGRKYDIAKGCLISGKYIRPGELIGCRCVCKSVFPFKVAV